MIKFFYWPVAVLLMAAGQGLLLPAIRRTVPGPEAKRQSFALHYLLIGAYFLPLVLAPSTWLIAILSRLLLFDVVLNLADVQPAFAVGNTALTDRALRWLAARLSWPPERVRLVVWVVSVVGACLLLIVKWK